MLQHGPDDAKRKHPYFLKVEERTIFFDGRQFFIHPIIDDLYTINLQSCGELLEKADKVRQENTGLVARIFRVFKERPRQRGHPKITTEHKNEYTLGANKAIKYASVLEDEQQVLLKGVTSIHNAGEQETVSRDLYLEYLHAANTLDQIAKRLQYRALTLKQQEETLRNPELIWHTLVQRQTARNQQ